MEEEVKPGVLVLSTRKNYLRLQASVEEEEAVMVHCLPNHQKVVGFGLVNLGANLDNSVKHCCCCCCFHSIDIDFLRNM